MTYPELLLFIMMTAGTIGLTFTIGCMIYMIFSALRS